MKTKDVFDKIQSLLISTIPETIGSLEFDGPLCVLRIYYYDTHAPYTYLDFRCITAAERQKVLDEQGKDALLHIWAAGEECGVRPCVALPNDPPATVVDEHLRTLFATVFDQLLEDEEVGMRCFRSALQSVSRRLNALNWTSVCTVTDDFVIAPADGSQFFCDEYDDLTNSIPVDKLELLRARGFFGLTEVRDQSEDDLTDAKIKAIIQELRNVVADKPVDEKTAYWSAQLDKVIANIPLADKRLDFGVDFVFEEVSEFSKEFVVPALKVALRWAGEPEFVWPNGTGGEPEHTNAGRVWQIYSEVKDLGYASAEIELLLRQCLEMVCSVNQSNPVWGSCAAWCAECLATLFDKYPSPHCNDDTSALVNADEYFAIPLHG